MESCQDGKTCVECLAKITFVPAWPPTQLTVLVIPECAENLTIEIQFPDKILSGIHHIVFLASNHILDPTLFIHVTLSVSLYVCHSMCVALCVSLYVCHSFCVALCVSLYVWNSMYVTLCVAQYVFHSMCVHLYVLLHVCHYMFGTLCMSLYPGISETRF